MSKLDHTNLAITSATLATDFQVSGATAGTTSSTNCLMSGLAIKTQADPRATTTTTRAIVTGATGNLTIMAVNDSETTIS